MNPISSSYYLALSCAYAAGLLGWWMVNSFKPHIWKKGFSYQFTHPWRETLWALAASLATLALGQLYSLHLLLPEISAIKWPIANSINQLIIFSPFIFLLFIRRHPLKTAWLPADYILARLLTGLVLAFFCVVLFILIYGSSKTLLEILVNIYHPKNLGYAVQVFLEDFVIAILFVRLRSAVGQKWFLAAIITVAFLFSFAHYPMKLSQGLSFLVATREIIMDGLLVSMVVYVVQRSGDILWFWCIHFAMDMLQFYAR